jgi:hypothetical protein
VTVGACFVLGAFTLAWSAWDEFTCVAGESTSSGPCGIGLPAAGGVLLAALCLGICGCIVLFRALRRPIDATASDGWRFGQAFVVMGSAVVIAIMIPRYACPAGMRLSPLFRFCLSADAAFHAPSPGLPWKFAAAGAGIVVGIVMMRWRSMPWWLASPIVVAAFMAAVLWTAARTTGLPGARDRAYTVGAAVAQTGTQTTSSREPRSSPNASAKWVGATTVPG